MLANLDLQDCHGQPLAVRVAELLRSAAERVADDPEGSYTRVAEATVLLGTFRSWCGKQSSRALAPWQERMVRAHIDEHLDETLRIEVLARITRLSSGHFFRAFKGTFGMSPHSFVLQRRVGRAAELLRDGDESLAMIALSCGFADQAHFSRIFSRSMGLPPGSWRRHQRLGGKVSQA